jgi:hypothetical protein
MLCNKSNRKIMARVVCSGVSLLLFSSGCLALSLGPVQGVALLGRPLELSVPVTLAADESAAGLCAQSRVFYADSLVSASSVQVATGSPSADGRALIKVHASPAVNESFVNLEVSAGCSQRITRSYVLLTDPGPIDRTPSTQAVVSIAVPVVTSPAMASNSGALPTADAPVRVKSSAAKTPLPPAMVTTRTVSTSHVPAGERPVQGARLKLDPVDLVAAASNWTPVLRMSADFPSEPAADSPELTQKREAARLLWKSLTLSAEELATQDAKARVAQTELAQVQARAAAARQSATELEAQLQEERDTRFLNPVVLGLALALLAALGGLGWLLLRARDGAGESVLPGLKSEKPLPWWKKKTVDGLQRVEPSEARRDKGLAGVLNTVLARNRPLDIDVDTLFPEDDLRQSAEAASVPKTSSGKPVSDFMPSTLMDGGRSVATEELFDLQQQVEFFKSLGQTEQAVEVLVAHLAESPEPSPLAYLDLLKLYHDLGRRGEFDALRAQFNGKFGERCPSFEKFLVSRRGLDRYEKAFSRIQSLWPTRAVLDLIERTIFPHPSDALADETFDLEAYRDLLLLYGIAREVCFGESSEFSAGSGPFIPMPVTSEAAARGGAQAGVTLLSPLSAELGMQPKAGELPAASKAAAVGRIDASFDDVVTEAFADAGIDLPLDLDLTTDFDLHGDIAPVSDMGDRSPRFRELDRSRVQQPPPPELSLPPFAGSSSAISPSVDLEFSDLDDLDAFKIRKSGKPL